MFFTYGNIDIELLVGSILLEKYNGYILPPNIFLDNPKEHNEIKLPYRDIFDKYNGEILECRGDALGINEVAKKIAEECSTLPQVSVPITPP